MGRDPFLRNTLILLLSFVLIPAMSTFADLEKAKDNFELYKESIKLSQQALQTKSQLDYQKHESNSLVYLSAARKAFLNSGIASQPDHADFSVFLEFLEVAGDYDLGIRYLENLTEEKKGNAELFQHLGNFAYLAGPNFYEQSFHAYRNALALDDSNAKTYLRLAQLYREQGLYTEAISNLEKALALDEELAEAKVELSCLLLREGEVVKASTLLDELGKDAIPYDVQTRLLLRESFHDLETYGLTFIDTAEYQKAYARLLYRAARLTDAMLVMYRAVKLAPEDGESWQFIGDMHQQSGNIEGAIVSYEEALKYITEKDNLQKLVDSLKQYQRQQQQQQQSPLQRP